MTGVLSIALGRATRVSQVLLKSGKEYVCLMHLHSDIDEEKLRKAMQEYVGKIQQMPPIKSAVKRQLRTREIYYIDILALGLFLAVQISLLNLREVLLELFFLNSFSY